MSIVLEGSTSGSITLQEPAIAGNTVLSLPARTSTILGDDGAGKVRKVDLPTGSILQVVSNNLNPSVQFTMTSSTVYTTWSNAPSATITLTNSANRVLIIARIGMQFDASDQIRNTIYREISGGSSTDLSGGNTYGLSFHGVSGSGGNWKESTITWIDTPNTSSAITYKWYSRSESGGLIYPDHGGATNNITLIEIAS